MDSLRESYHLFPRCSTLTSIFFEAFPFTDKEMSEAGLLGDGEFLSLLRVYTHLPLSHIDVSQSVRQAIETMKAYPETFEQVP